MPQQFLQQERELQKHEMLSFRWQDRLFVSMMVAVGMALNIRITMMHRWSAVPPDCEPRTR